MKILLFVILLTSCSNNNIISAVEEPDTLYRTIQIDKWTPETGLSIYVDSGYYWNDSVLVNNNHVIDTRENDSIKGIRWFNSNKKTTHVTIMVMMGEFKAIALILKKED